MPTKERLDQDKELRALQAVHKALKDLSPDARKKVLTSISALLEISGSDFPASATPKQAVPQNAPTPEGGKSSRPLSIRELIQDKKPGTNTEKIALFAYYREKYEGVSRFSRGDLETYFQKARENPPKNYDRDFNNTVLKGWIHEDGEDSYITSKGLEAVESGFQTVGQSVRGKTRERSPKKSRSKRK